MDDARKKAELRARMKDAAQKREKRIDSPLVRYNNLGQPVCQICDVTVKSEVLWPTHLASRGHKEMVESLKRRVGGGGEPAPTPAAAAPSRAASASATGAANSSAGQSKQSALPAGFFDEPTAPASAPATPTNTSTGAGKVMAASTGGGAGTARRTAMPPPAAVQVARGAAPADVATRHDGAAALPVGVAKAAASPVVAEEPRKVKQQGLPAGFFDGDGASMAAGRGVAPVARPVVTGALTSTGNGSGEVGGGDGSGAPLPKGFFDDTAADHKARGVELVKPDIQKEWGEFQKVVIEKEKEADEARAMEEQEDAAEELEEREAVLQRDVQSRIAQIRQQKELQLQLKKRKGLVEGGVGWRGEASSHKNKKRGGGGAGVLGNGNDGSDEDDGEEIPEDVLFDWRIKKL
eukprot:jgi/Mesvir1/3985/Mv15041-RA.1